MVDRMDIVADLQARGLVHDSTDLEALAKRLADGPMGVYIGFDPSADSLHAGNLVGQLMLRRFQLAGHRVFALAGGATGMVGDPGGRSEERNLLDRETLRHNVAAIKGQLERLLDFEAGPLAATLVDNADWTAPIGVLDFLRDVGKHVTVNQMLAKESVKARVESTHGISFTEFSYMLLQANDFRHLCEHHDVELQMGGSDQWGNITTGIDLIRRTLGRSAYGLTHPLLTRSDGAKMGKSVTGAVWLDPAKTSPYQFHQFWVQLPDADVERFLLQLTLRPVSEIAEIVAAHRQAPERRAAQRLLARDLTALVHGPEAAALAEAAADVLFGGDPTAASADVLAAVGREVPSSVVPAHALDDLVELLVTTGLATSKGDARRGLAQAAFSVNGARVSIEDRLGSGNLLRDRYVLLSKGRRNHHLLEISPGVG
jgi:tyrosyl-tRNA synthetase